jgi:NADH:ubiquinone oxidoreductase subunit B-like Fe-S oxidoreductase
MPDPKYVIAVGSCALSGGVFDGCYSVIGDLNKVIPVDVYIPGCPPRPEAIIFGVVQLLDSLKKGKKPAKFVVPNDIPDFKLEEKSNGNN